MNAAVEEIVASKVEKMSQFIIDRKAKAKVKEILLAKRTNAQRSKSATQLVVKSETMPKNPSTAVKAASQKKPATNASKTPQKS